MIRFLISGQFGRNSSDPKNWKPALTRRESLARCLTGHFMLLGSMTGASRTASLTLDATVKEISIRLAQWCRGLFWRHQSYAIKNQRGGFGLPIASSLVLYGRRAPIIGRKPIILIRTSEEQAKYPPMVVFCLPMVFTA